MTKEGWGVGEDSLRQLQTALMQIEAFIQAAVARARETNANPTDALRGLVITDEEIDALMQQAPLANMWADASRIPALADLSAHGRFSDLISIFELNALDAHILLLCLAAEFDRRYERLFAYLQDDVSQRRPSVNLMLNLLGGSSERRLEVWERLLPQAPLRANHLIECFPDPHQREPVFLAYQLKADARIASYVLGDDHPDARLGEAVRIEPAAGGRSKSSKKRSEATMVALHGPDGAGGAEIVQGWCARDGLALAQVQLDVLKTVGLPYDLAWRLALREARLARAAVLMDNWEQALDASGQPPRGLWAALLAYELPVYLNGRSAWEPRDTYRTRRLLRLKLGSLAYEEQVQRWQEALEGQGIRVDETALEELASKFRFTPGQIARAVQSALDYAASRGEAVTLADLYGGAQAQSTLNLGKLAQRIRPRFIWDDLILPDDRVAQLRELCTRARYAHTVRDMWGFGRKVAPHTGVSALFAGESGTGKTMSAEVIASELGLLLYKIDLSSVVSKYIGETEKNLSAIFAEATASSALLFFDEADALFGKRSEVKDAHDRYANIEIAYLLQQIEAYDGIAVLATNLRQNLDEAFTRRLDFLVDFPFPEAEYRQQIWVAHFPPEAPLAAEVNLGELAARYRLAGGNIRNAALASAYLAAADGGVITMTHIRHAVRREHQKMGRLLEDDLQPAY